MLLAQQPTHCRQHLLLKLARFRQIALRVQRLSEIEHRRERGRMLLAQQTTPCRQHLLLKLARFRQMALRVQRYSEIEHRRERVRMLLAQQTTPCRQHLLLKLARRTVIGSLVIVACKPKCKRSVLTGLQIDADEKACVRDVCRNPEMFSDVANPPEPLGERFHSHGSQLESSFLTGELEPHRPTYERVHDPCIVAQT